MKLTTISALTNSLTLSLLIPAALVVATADGSIVKRDALHTTPTFTSPFLGDRFRANPRSKNLDDQVLVTKLGGTRRLSKIQLWCSDDTIFSMQPWYHGHGYDVQHWQYADNRNGGRYKEFLIKDTEYISIVRYDFCGTPGHVRLCYLYLSKDPVPGHPGDSGSIDCGHVRHDCEYRYVDHSIVDQR